MATTITVNAERRAALMNDIATLDKRARDANEEAYELVNGDGEFKDSKDSAKHATLLQRAEIAKADAENKREELATLPEPVLHSSKQEKGAFTRFLQGGIEALGEDEVRTYCSANGEDSKSAGSFNLSEYARQLGGQYARQMNTLRSDVDSSGKQATPENVANMLIHRLKYEGAVGAVCRNISTPTGNTFRYPYLDDTGNEGADDDFVQGANIADVNLGQITGDEFTATTVNSGFVNVQEEALQDINSFGLEMTIMELLRRRIGRRQNIRMTVTQTGNKITGVVNAAGETHTQAAAGIPKYTDLIDLMAEVDGAYVEGTEGGAYGFVQDPLGGMTGFMTNRKGLFDLMKVEDGDNRPILRPDITSGGTVTPWGYPVVQNNRMADRAANARWLLFGNFGYYLLRNVADIRIRRIDGSTDKTLAATNAVAFVAVKRLDAGLIAHTSGANRGNYTHEALAALVGA